MIFSCVDRPWPRHVLNAMAYNDLITVIDGGIYALVDGDRFVHANWRIHTVGPGRGCLICIKALDRDDVSLDIAGKLDDPDYIKNLPKEKQSCCPAVTYSRSPWRSQRTRSASRWVHLRPRACGRSRTSGLPLLSRRDGGTSKLCLRTGLRVPSSDRHLR